MGNPGSYYTRYSFRIVRLDGESGIAEIKTSRFTTLSLTRHF
jgi:hypothetical protein